MVIKTHEPKILVDLVVIIRTQTVNLSQILYAHMSKIVPTCTDIGNVRAGQGVGGSS